MSHLRIVRPFYVLLAVMVVMCYMTFPACSNGGSDSEPSLSPQSITGVIEVGESIVLSTQQAGTDGALITMQKPGDPLDGMEITVPPQAYTDTKEFRITSSPITSHTFGEYFNPITPLISVENGGGYADEVITVKVPVEIPDDHFAMGFLYDETTKSLEGMPLIAVDSSSITIATRHFSDFTISAVANSVLDSLLKKDIDSHFRPGIDDWQFTNRGSYIAPGGHCEGQSLTAMWYFCEQPDGRDLTLFGRYDNNGNHPSTPSLWQDDSLGYRFCAIVQQEKYENKEYAKKFWDTLGGKGYVYDRASRKWNWVDVPGIGDEATQRLFAYSIQLTGEPQEAVIRGQEEGDSHAMICYRIFKGNLYIADPNYPGNTERRIEFVDGKFKPYNSGANKEEIEAGRGEEYDRIQYRAKSTIVPWENISQHWQEFKNKTIGNDKFPAYRIVYVDKDGNYMELKDGTIFDTNKVNFYVDYSGTVLAGVYVFRDGVKLPYDADGKFELSLGNNLLGFNVVKQVGTAFKYVDFKYINVVYQKEEPTPTATSGFPGGDYVLVLPHKRYEMYEQMWRYAESYHLPISLKDGLVKNPSDLSLYRSDLQSYSQEVTGSYDSQGNLQFTFEFKDIYPESGGICKGTFSGKIEKYLYVDEWDIKGTARGTQRSYYTGQAEAGPFDAETEFEGDVYNLGYSAVNH